MATVTGPLGPRTRVRHGTGAEWTTLNPLLEAGEVGWDTTAEQLKIGDGEAHWTDLGYLGEDASETFESLEVDNGIVVHAGGILVEAGGLIVTLGDTILQKVTATIGIFTGALSALSLTGALAFGLSPGAHLSGGTFNNTGNVTIATDATNANTASTIVARDASGNFVASAITAALVGNASTATALQTPRTIGGVSFDGTANITVASATGGFAVTGAALTAAAGLTVSAGATSLQSVSATTGTLSGLWTFDAGATIASGQTITLTGATVAGAPTWSSTQSLNTTGFAATLQTARAISITGDLTWTVSFNGSAAVTAAGTLATVNSNVGAFGSSTAIPTVTVNAKGLVTAVSGNAVIAPAGTLTGTTLNATVVTSSLTTVGVLVSPHMTGVVVDSGGLTITAGTLGAQAVTATTVGATGVVSSTASGGGFNLTPSGAGAATYYVMDNTVNGGGKRWRFGYSGGAGGSVSSFDIYNQTDSTMAFTLSSAGALSITGSIEASIAGGVTGLMRVTVSGATSAPQVWATNSTGIASAIFGVTRSDGSGWGTGGLAYAGVFYTTNAFQVFTNSGILALTISTAQAATFAGTLTVASNITQTAGTFAAQAITGTTIQASGTIRSGSGSGESLASGSVDVGKDIGLATTQGLITGGTRWLSYETATTSVTIAASAAIAGPISSGTTPAASGQVRLPYNTFIAWRNSINTVDHTLGVAVDGKLTLAATAGTVNLSVSGALFTLSNNTTASAANAFIDGVTGEHKVSTSRRAAKKEISSIELREATAFIDALDPVWFKSKLTGDDPRRWHAGLILEEVHQAEKAFVYGESLAYERIAVPLVRVVQDHGGRLKKAERTITDLTTRLARAEQQLLKLAA